MMLDSIYVIADVNSERYDKLQNELACLARFVISNTNIKTIYKYKKDSIRDIDYYRYWTWPDDRETIGWSEGIKILNKTSFSLCLNHLECLISIMGKEQNKWSIICEDDIFIPNKNTFDTDFVDILTTMPKDADIIWISSGKKPVNCGFRDVTGYDSPEPLDILHNRYLPINKSRYADCILIKHSAAKFIAKKFLIHKFTIPIDWEYNYILNKYDSIKSYWLVPAIIQQNPEFL
jgi:hypothetical protein